MHVDTIIICIIIILMLLLSLKKLSYGLSFFICVRILVPEDVRLYNISLNTCMILILTLISFFNFIIFGFKRTKGKNTNFLIGCAIFCLYCFISLFISNYGNLSAQLNYLIQFICTEIIPCLLAFIILKSKNDIRIFINTFLAVCFITTIYGIFTYITKTNPYRSLWTNYIVTVKNDFWYGNYTTSTFVSTNTFGYYICLSFPFMAILYYNGICKKMTFMNLILLSINAVLTKKRTVIVCLLLFFILQLFVGNTRKKFRNLIICIPILLIGFLMVFNIPQFYELKKFILTSIFFWDDSLYNSVVQGNGGSSWGLRLRQFTYPFIEISDNLIFGHGFGWCGWFLAQGEIHPVLYGFESLVSSGICEFGIFGLILLIIIFVLLFKFTYARYDKYVLLFLMNCLVMYIGTGIQYIYLFLLLNVLINKIKIFYPNVRKGVQYASINYNACLQYR